MLAADEQHLRGRITSQNVPQAVARQMRTARAATGQAQRAAGPALPGLRAAAREAPPALPGYQILEITIPAGSPAAGRALGDITWRHEWIPVTVMDNRALRDAGPGIALTPGDRVNLLAREQVGKVRATPDLTDR